MQTGCLLTLTSGIQCVLQSNKYDHCSRRLSCRQAYIFSDLCGPAITGYLLINILTASLIRLYLYRAIDVDGSRPKTWPLTSGPALVRRIRLIAGRFRLSNCAIRPTARSIFRTIRSEWKPQGSQSPGTLALQGGKECPPSEVAVAPSTVESVN